MRATLRLAALAAAIAVAGCGGSGGGKKTVSAAAAADNFIACFKKPGYKAIRPMPGDASLFAAEAKKHGYDAVAVNITSPGSPSADAFLVFFKDEASKKKAKDELAVTNAGDAPPLDKGQVFGGYFAPALKPELEPAIVACL